MKNILIHNGTGQQLLSNVDDGSNTIFINDAEIPSSSWVGSGSYTQDIDGTTIYIEKVAALVGDIMMQRVSENHYRLVVISSGSGTGNYIAWKDGSYLVYS